MQFFLSLFLISVAVQVSVAPPVTQNKKDDQHEETEAMNADDRAVRMEYQRYLTEVVEALESDPEFRAKLQKAEEADIRTGKIAEQLKFVNHNVRSLLDELKRNELERLKHLATKENELMNGLDVDHLKIAEHLDHTNTRTFEIQDLKKLIAKTTKDLAEADARRREDFKKHEMAKKYEEQQKLQGMTDNDRKKYEEELEALKEQHKKHEPVHHPGSKQQLEEVWEKQDHMESDDFNPRTFFFLHDVDGNSVWDQDEVKALFLKELDKLYAQGATEEDMLKRTEEMERMREHVFNEADLNKDGLISLDEFLEQTKKPDFQQDEGWEGLDEQQIYTPEEFEHFEKHKQQQLQYQISKGMPPPHAGNIPDYHEPLLHKELGGLPQFPPQYVNVPVAQGHHQQFQGDNHQQQYQHQEVPMQQQFTNNQPMHGSQQQHYQPQMQQHQQVQGHPQQQYHPGQIPPNQQQIQHNQQQVPVQQQQYQQPPQPQHGQVPPQQQQGPPPVQHQPYQQPQQPQQPQHGQVQMQQQQQQSPPNVQQQVYQQNTANLNQVPHNAPGNPAAAVPPAAVPQNIQTQTQQKNVNGGQAAAQPQINRNEIHAGGKA